MDAECEDCEFRDVSMSSVERGNLQTLTVYVELMRRAHREPTARRLRNPPLTSLLLALISSFNVSVLPINTCTKFFSAAVLN